MRSLDKAGKRPSQRRVARVGGNSIMTPGLAAVDLMLILIIAVQILQLLRS
jgi:hypothetical protein